MIIMGLYVHYSPQCTYIIICGLAESPVTDTMSPVTDKVQSKSGYCSSLRSSPQTHFDFISLDRGQVGIEPTTSRTQIENHTTRPLTQSTYAFLAERSKALRSGRSIFGCVGSNPTECIDTHCYNHHQFW